MKLGMLPGSTGWMEANCRHLNGKKMEVQRFMVEFCSCTGINPKYFLQSKIFPPGEVKTQ